ncbi:MAG: hypothetical protein WCG08_14675 [Paludibacter sp.]|jgi:hypothetical protein
MKKLILLIALSLFLTHNAISQTLPYKPFSQFNGDIESYLKYNFVDRSDYYKGKSFGDLMKDMETSPLEYFGTYLMPSQGNDILVTKITLVFKHTRADGRYSIRDTQIAIVWETPFSSTLWKDLNNQYPKNNWVIEHYDFFKDKKIKGIWYGE